MLDENLLLVLEDAKEHMDKSMEHIVSELRTIRAGRATPSLLEGVRVEYYGSQSPHVHDTHLPLPTLDLV
mgnify:CR=1 FL=1